jgi:hypothetical protein
VKTSGGLSGEEEREEEEEEEESITNWGNDVRG